MKLRSPGPRGAVPKTPRKALPHAPNGIAIARLCGAKADRSGSFDRADSGPPVGILGERLKKRSGQLTPVSAADPLASEFLDNSTLLTMARF
jgi:hypothetical protein